jgi:tetrahydromethanopterin S-methyltransferase subunit G
MKEQFKDPMLIIQTKEYEYLKTRITDLEEELAELISEAQTLRSQLDGCGVGWESDVTGDYNGVVFINTDNK